jgi:hypothetical protein
MAILQWQVPQHSMHGDLVALIAPHEDGYHFEVGQIPTAEGVPHRYFLTYCRHLAHQTQWEGTFPSIDAAQAYAAAWADGWAAGYALGFIVGQDPEEQYRRLPPVPSEEMTLS